MQAYRDLMGFLLAMNNAVKGMKISNDYPVSQVSGDFVNFIHFVYFILAQVEVLADFVSKLDSE